MKVGISSVGLNLNAQLDERFGRAQYILIVDTDRGLLEAVSNGDNRNAMQGAGIGTAQLVADRAVECVVSGHVGPKAFAALQAAGIAVYAAPSGSCDEALGLLKAGKLTQVTAPDVVGHW